MEKKTKIFAVGDIHGDTGLVKKLAAKAKKEDVDLILITGDLTSFEISTKNLLGPFVKTKKPVFILPGNHESPATIDFLADTYKGSKNLHGYSFSKGDLGIFGAGGATQIGPMPVISEKNMFKMLEKGFSKVKDKPKKIMITHEHPEGSKSEFGGEMSGSKAIARAVKKFKPDILIHGHIHEGEGFQETKGKTKIINVGKKGKIFKI